MVGWYRGSLLYKVPPSLTSLLLISFHVAPVLGGRPAADDIVVMIVCPLLLTVLWTLPATVITTAGYRRALRYRLVGWQNVAAVLPAEMGIQDVVVALHTGEKVSLARVNQDRRTGVEALVDGSSHPDSVVNSGS